MNEHLSANVCANVFVCESEILLHLIHIETAEFTFCCCFSLGDAHTVHTNTQLMEFQLIESIPYTNRKIIKTLFYCTLPNAPLPNWKFTAKIHPHTVTVFSLIKKRFYFILLYQQVMRFPVISISGGFCVLFFNWFDFIYMDLVYVCVKTNNRVNEDLCWSSIHQCVLPSSGNSRLSDA